MTRGGRRRTTLDPPPIARTPSSCNAWRTGAAFPRNSMPIIKPSPRISRTEGAGSVACLTGGRQVFRGRHMHAAFTLDRLEDDRRGIMIDGFPQSLDVVERDMLESGDERLERLTEILPPGRAECPHRPSMETAHRRDDLLPSCRGARKFDRGLDGLGARVAQEDSTEVSRCDGEELLDEGRLRGRPEHGSDVDQLPRLGLDCLDDGRIAMS